MIWEKGFHIWEICNSGILYLIDSSWRNRSLWGRYSTSLHMSTHLIYKVLNWLVRMCHSSPCKSNFQEDWFHERKAGYLSVLRPVRRLIVWRRDILLWSFNLVFIFRTWGASSLRFCSKNNNNPCFIGWNSCSSRANLKQLNWRMWRGKLLLSINFQQIISFAKNFGKRDHKSGISTHFGLYSPLDRFKSVFPLPLPILWNYCWWKDMHSIRFCCFFTQPSRRHH